MANFARGQRLGPYETLESIGAGGMGEVWKARDTRLGRLVAIKVSKDQFSERFDREARAVAALNHPHICQLYDVGPNYLVMEFIEGTSVRGPLPVTQAVEYAGQILEALDAAHRKGITHRDLKPANILITKQGIKLLDFGLAKQSAPLKRDGDTLTRALTSQGTIVGTLQYMSPEQLQGRETDTRSDLFAFGCVLYEMLTGKRAFGGDSTASVIASILESEPEPLTTAPPLERVVRRAMAKDPEQRFQTARDLKAALMWAMENAPPAPRVARMGLLLWLAGVLATIAAVTSWMAMRMAVWSKNSICLNSITVAG
jgi:serine/threonine protein kinase